MWHNMLLECYRKQACCVVDIPASMEPAKTALVKNFEGYIICKSLGYQEDDIKRAYEANDSNFLEFYY